MIVNDKSTYSFGSYRAHGISLMILKYVQATQLVVFWQRDQILTRGFPLWSVPTRLSWYAC